MDGRHPRTYFPPTLPPRCVVDHLVSADQRLARKVILAYDRDEAGEKAAAALASELIAMGIEW